MSTVRRIGRRLTFQVIDCKIVFQKAEKNHCQMSVNENRVARNFSFCFPEDVTFYLWSSRECKSRPGNSDLTPGLDQGGRDRLSSLGIPGRDGSQQEEPLYYVDRKRTTHYRLWRTRNLIRYASATKTTAKLGRYKYTYAHSPIALCYNYCYQYVVWAGAHMCMWALPQAFLLRTFGKTLVRKKTQVFGKTQIIFSKTQVFSQKIRVFSSKSHIFSRIEIKVTK